MAHIHVEAEQVRSDHGLAYLNFVGRDFCYGIAAWRIVSDANPTYIIFDPVRKIVEILILDNSKSAADALESLLLTRDSRVYLVADEGLKEISLVDMVKSLIDDVNLEAKEEGTVIRNGYDDVNGVIVGGEYYTGQLFYDGRAQTERIYADSEGELIEMAKAKKRQLVESTVGLGVYQDDSLWQLRIYE